MPDRFSSFLWCKLFATTLFLWIIVSSVSLSIKLMNFGSGLYYFFSKTWEKTMNDKVKFPPIFIQKSCKILVAHSSFSSLKSKLLELHQEKSKKCRKTAKTHFSLISHRLGAPVQNPTFPHPHPYHPWTGCHLTHRQWWLPRGIWYTSSLSYCP